MISACITRLATQLFESFDRCIQGYAQTHIALLGLMMDEPHLRPMTHFCPKASDECRIRSDSEVG